jgi:hypothetical protein
MGIPGVVEGVVAGLVVVFWISQLFGSEPEWDVVLRGDGEGEGVAEAGFRF